MLSERDGIAAGFSLLCLLYALTVFVEGTRALTSVKDFLLKPWVRGGHTHTHMRAHCVFFFSHLGLNSYGDV